MNKEYIKFQTEAETLAFLKKYDIIPKTYSSLPIFWYKTNWDKTHVECQVLGYEKYIRNMQYDKRRQQNKEDALCLTQH